MPVLRVPSPPAFRALIGWRAGFLARACGCSYKNPRVPALSSKKRVSALPSAVSAPVRASGLALFREALGRGPVAA